ncbi:hypothetical protein HRbin11_02329 [bacterium HR11]|nr:hypothetical protein HRbin11_02329 [bacterium HR11]
MPKLYHRNWLLNSRVTPAQLLAFSDGVMSCSSISTVPAQSESTIAQGAAKGAPIVRLQGFAVVHVSPSFPPSMTVHVGGIPPLKSSLNKVVTVTNPTGTDKGSDCVPSAWVTARVIAWLLPQAVVPLTVKPK